jgi:hypothetical protein
MAAGYDISIGISAVIYSAKHMVKDPIGPQFSQAVKASRIFTFQQSISPATFKVKVYSLDVDRIFANISAR